MTIYECTSIPGISPFPNILLHFHVHFFDILPCLGVVFLKQCLIFFNISQAIYCFPCFFLLFFYHFVFLIYSISGKVDRNQIISLKNTDLWLDVKVGRNFIK